ncbi:MAG TPA: hypothetical protein VL977_04330, partial [Solirubrobacteraceae bacterium]|nr:hypothetical protein [Solirubrobacteraceae bacterium]
MPASAPQWPEPPTGARGRVIFLAGKDPEHELGAGHSSYVRAHGLAARAAGYAPQILCLGRQPGVLETAYGTVHRVATRARPVRQVAIELHARPLAAAAAALAREGDGPALLHGFGVWSYAGLVAARELRAGGRQVALLVSSYTTYRDEARSQLGSSGGAGVAPRVAALGHAALAYGVVAPRERAAYLGADEVLVNYASVERLVRRRFGSRVRVSRCVYGPEAAFGEPSASADGAFPSEPAGAPLLLSAGHHQRRKGNDLLIAALARLKRDGVAVRACLVSGGSLHGAHRRLIGRLGL